MTPTAEPAPRTEAEYMREQFYIERADNRRARQELAEDRTPPPRQPRRRPAKPQPCRCDMCTATTWRARHGATP